MSRQPASHTPNNPLLQRQIQSQPQQQYQLQKNPEPIITDEEEDKYLDNALKKIKTQSFHINTAMENNNLRQCLREAYTMLCELKTNFLTPKRYYHLYTSVFDIMLNIKNYMSEEISRGRRLIDLYDSVQQAQHVIPRLYLMITAGAIYMEKVPRSTKIIIFDMLGLVKSVQNPIKGLFTRNYLLKMIKDKLPDKDNVYLKEGGEFGDTIKFIIQNLEEMNRLWIRISSGVSGQELIKREKERGELKILIGESINRLSSLESLTQEIYEQQVLPKLLKIIVESKDVLSQQYLMECIIHAFPDSFNIKCIDSILDNMTKLINGVEIGTLFVTLMQKMSKFFGDNNNSNENDEEHKKIIESAKNVYPILLKNFDALMTIGIQKGNNKGRDNNNYNNDMTKSLDLIISFMKFSSECSPEEQRLESISHILTTTVTVLSNGLQNNNRNITEEEIKKLTQILLEPINSHLNIFDMKDFGELMNYLDIKSRKTLGIKLIETLISGKSTEKLDSVEKLQKIIQFIQPLLVDENLNNENNNINTNNNNEEDPQIFEYEQNIVSKLIFIVDSQNPEVLYEVYNEFKNIFSHGGPRRRKITLPSLASVIIQFCNKIAVSYDYKNNNLNKNKKLNKHTIAAINSIDITKIENDEMFYKLMLNIYKLLNETISLISQENSELAYKLYLTSAAQVNNISTAKEKFQEACLSFLNTAVGIYESDNYDKKNMFTMTASIIGYLMDFSILTLQQKEEITQEIIKGVQQNMISREEQCKCFLMFSQVYFNLFKDGKKVLECVSKAKRFAEFAMTNPKNLDLFVEFLNKLIYFADQEEGVVEIKPEQIEDIIELIRGHIRTIKSLSSGNQNIDYLKDIENYFNNTIKCIKIRKENSPKKEFYQGINV